MTEHGGDVFSYEKQYKRKPVADFSANTNPLGISKKAKEALSALLEDSTSLSSYPDRNSRALKTALSGEYGIKESKIVCGAGAVEIIYNVALAFSRGKKSLIASPAFSEYKNALTRAGASEIESVIAKEEDDFLLSSVPDTTNCALFFICSPSNPAGAVTSYDFLEKCALQCQKTNTILVLDACFSPFDDEAQQSVLKLCKKMSDESLSNIVIIGAFTKFYALAGLRAGFALCSDEKTARTLEEIAPPWSLSTAAQVAAVASLADSEFKERTKALIDEEREYMREKLSCLGIKKVWGRANFLLFRSRIGLKSELERKGIMIRSCSSFDGLNPAFFRVAIKSRRENDELLSALRACLSEKGACKFLMIQGTMSNAGKSFLTAALCRIFHEDGLRTVPFKAQNMALNSAVASDYSEIGRAQEMQARAAGVLSDYRMNPILLKPTSHTSSQVIVCGKAVSDMNALQYFKKKKDLMPVVLQCLESLASENDIIVIEGAGSPAEINLRENDIVNMGLATKINSPVLLASDIDRGGVFAQLYGTISLLDDEEKRLIKALVINKFRGDKALLASGVEQIEALTGKKVAGVIPMIDIRLDEEDSLSQTLEIEHNKGEAIKIAVIRLPHISNFTDFEPFIMRKTCNVRFIKSAEDLKEFSPHLIILPGTKNTLSDLDFLKQTQLFDTILTFVSEKKSVIIGICGGFQMLGKKIRDFEGVESEKQREESALSLLEAETDFEKEKFLSNVSQKLPKIEGFFSFWSEKEASGYEIHCGRTNGCDKNFDGMVSGEVFGTYLHGFFDVDEITNELLKALCAHFSIKDAQIDESFCFSAEKEKEFSKLSSHVRKNLDMSAIYKILEEEN